VTKGGGSGVTTLSTRSFAVLMSILFCNMVGLGAVFALLPKLQDAHGLPTAGLGLIGGISVLMSVTAQLTLARYADRGHTIRMLKAGIAAITVGFLWMAFATELWQFVGARALAGLGAGVYMPAARRIVVTRDPARAGELLGRLTAAEVGGFVIGPPLALTLTNLIDLRAPFLFPAILMLVVGLAVRSLVEPPVAAPGSPRAAGGAIRTLLADPAVRAAVVIGATVNLSVGAFEPIIAKQLTDIGAGDVAIVVTLSLFALPYVLFTAAGGRLADRHGPHRTAVLTLACTVPIVASFGLATTAVVVCVLGVARSMFDTITTPAGISAMARSSPPSQLATGQGLYGAVSQAMSGTAAMLGAPLYAASGARVLWIVVGVAMLCLTAWAAWLARAAEVWVGVSADPSPA
jgi:MFS family permease